MLDTPDARHDARLNDGRPAHRPVERDAEFDRIPSFLATAKTHGAALLVPGEPGVGKTGLLDAASEAASANATLEILSPSTRPQARAAGHADREGG